MKKFFWFIAGVLVFVFLVSFISTSVFMYRGGSTEDLSSANIGVIEITGVITESLPVLEQIREFKKNKQLKALLVRLDTPGGAVGASQEIYLELKKLKETKPVVVSMGNVAASGGLYISIGASEVVALPGSITGSMGVMMPITNLSKLMDRIYVEPITIKSGKFKDAGSPLRPMDQDSRAYLQDMVDMTFTQFREDVVTERELTKEASERLSDGRVVDGKTAQELGLVDQLGTFEDAVERLRVLAKIEGDAKLGFLSRKPKGLLHEIISGATTEIVQKWLTQASMPLYIWDADRSLRRDGF